MKYETKKVLKMGNKLGIFLGNDYENDFNIKKGDPVELEILNRNKKVTLISRMNYNIVLRKSLTSDIDPHTNVKIIIRKIKTARRTKNIFYKNKIDILSLIPEKTSNGYEIIVIQFDKNKEKHLRIWYSHKRGSCKQLEIRRYVDIELFASLLGQLQAEGAKKEALVEFTNILLSEHKDFTTGLKSIGVNDTGFFKSTNAYRTVVRYSSLGSILLNSMNTIRKILVVKELRGNLRIIADSFFSKLLIGDGTIDIGKRKVPQVSIKIVDGNRRYLKHYNVIMRKLGFRSHINQKRIWVKSSCSFENLIYLYKIRAFKNSNNWNKLIIAIKMLLGGRRLNTRYRFLYLRRMEEFSGLDIKKKYKVTLRAANDWINNNIEFGYIRKIKDSKLIKYKLTKKALYLANTLEDIEIEFRKIKKNKHSTNLHVLLDSLKVRNQPKSALTQGRVKH